MKCFVSMFTILFLLAVWGDLSFAQTKQELTETQVISFYLNSIQLGIQKSKPGAVRSIFQGSAQVDGIQMSDAEFRQTLDNLLSSLPDRNLHTNNPDPERFGTFWDFGIVDPSIQINGSICTVNCTYRVSASGVRTGLGLLELQKVGGTVWKLTRLNGLITFLQDEYRVVKSRHLMPWKKK